MKSEHAVVEKGNPWFAATMGLAGIIVGFVVATAVNGDGMRLLNNGGGAPTPTAPTPTRAAPPAGDVPEISATDHIRGNPDADIAIIEYSDFQCPFCARVHPTYMQLMEESGDDIAWVFRHFPLTSIHPDAQKAAEASECVAELEDNDAFWEFADLLFERGSADMATVLAVGKEIGLDETALKTCIDSGKYAQKVQADMTGGSAAGVNGTPGNIVINLKTKKSQLISGAQPLENFKAAIEAVK